MNRKRGIIPICIIVFAVAVVVGCYFSTGKTPALSKTMKAEILEAYITEMVGGEKHYNQTNRLVWFDENGGKRDPYVFRYFGTYGDCIVLLRYGTGKTATYAPIELPITLAGLARPVQYPVDCMVFLYNTNANYPTYDRLAAPLTSLYYLGIHNISWLTDEQLEQLTSDLEAWVAAGNY